ERYVEAMEVREKEYGSWGVATYILEGVLVVPALCFGIRVLGTLYWAARRPSQTLREMPQNWLRQSLCTDFTHPPEILPLEAARGENRKVPTFARLRHEIAKRKSVASKTGTLIVFLPFIVSGYLPSLIYRVS